MKNPISLTGITLLLAGSNLSAATHCVSLVSPNPTPPYTNWATAATNIQDAVDAAATSDVVLVTNGVYPGGVIVTNALTLLSVNGPQVTDIDGGGMNTCLTLTDGTSLTGFTLTNGVNPSLGVGGVWCSSTNSFLTNCVIVNNSGYGGVSGGTLFNCTLTGSDESGAFGSTLYNCILIDNERGASGSTLYNCTLTSNGGGVRGGGGAYSCTLYNCTLNSNSASLSGGGAEGSTLYNCRVTGNWVTGGWVKPPWSTKPIWVPGQGGGTDWSTLYNCTLVDNSAAYGGGASVCTLYNCTVVDNVASEDGGGVANACFLTNCIVAYNAAWTDDNYTTDTVLNHCCTAVPANGVGNISVPPQFADYVNGNLRLKSSSPCINAGNNAYMTTATDLDGNPRIVSGTVDIGAYEYQGTGSRISYAWLQEYDLPTDGSADSVDSDHDGMNNWQEWVCGTCPTNAQSVLRMVSATPTGTNTTVTWQSVSGVNYFLQRGANLGTPFTFVATNIIGQAGTTSYPDTNAAGVGPFFYRVGVQCP